MASLGTRKFYKAFDGKSDAAKNQILKNSGYISIVLHSVFYNSKGNFWQKIFGGVDKIALSSLINYQSGDRTIEARTIQDKREVKAGKNHFLGLSRLVALKVPAIADGLELKVSMTAIRKDNFENGINLMNSKEFQQPLQLSSIPIGQILAVTGVVKKIFTGIDQQNHLEATFAGIISQSVVTDAVEKERLCAGYLIMIANNDEDNNFLANIDVTKMDVEADGLKYDGKRVKHTNLVYSITFEALRGVDQASNWYGKYQDALKKLDDLYFAKDDDEKERILEDSRRLWVEASALLYDDLSYINEEKRSIKASFFKSISEKYKELTEDKEAIVVVDKFLDLKSNIDFMPALKKMDADSVLKETTKISAKYMKALGKMNMLFPES